VWNGERIAESAAKLPEAGYAPQPLSAAALGALLVVALALLRRRRVAWSWPRLHRPLRFAGQLALFVFAAVSCQSGGPANPLLPDEHTRYHVSDRLGSAALVLDHQGKPVARDAHDPYGAPALAWRADGERGPDYRFTGAEDTPRSGAVVLGARHYLPALGRWTAPDPYYLLNPGANLERPGERNLYRYAGNNPVQHVDPSGHGWISWVIKAGVRLYKGADKAGEVASAVEDISVVLNPEAGFGARVLSAVSLGSEYLPVSIGDIKDGYRWYRGSDRVVDTATSAKVQREAVAGYENVRDNIKAREPSKIDRTAFRKEREQHWRAEGQQNGGNYSAEDQAKLQKGRAPKGPDGHPMELHHVDRTPEGGLQPMSRTEHRLGKNYKKNHP